jgi:hypothetical protein
MVQVRTYISIIGPIPMTTVQYFNITGTVLIGTVRKNHPPPGVRVTGTHYLTPLIQFYLYYRYTVFTSTVLGYFQQKNTTVQYCTNKNSGAECELFVTP